jgi:YcaO cyclodehydratase, ATP-ad Mg2+-binding
MELTFSKRLTAMARALFLAPVDYLDIFVAKPMDGKNFTVTAEARIERGPLMSGTGSSSSEADAFIRALVELGEVWITNKLSLRDRNGLAGGLFKMQARMRAKAELIERDAFLFHYRKDIPFLQILDTKNIGGKNVLAFKMASADTKLTAVFAVDEAAVKGEAECLLMGMAAHRSTSLAIAKAFNEFSVMALDHAIRPGWCARLIEDLPKNPEKAARLPDFHHAHSRDMRNLNRIKHLCNTDGNFDLVKSTRSTKPILWSISDIESPVRFVKYQLVKTKDLIHLQFGVPESGGEIGFGMPALSSIVVMREVLKRLLPDRLVGQFIFTETVGAQKLEMSAPPPA